MGREVMRVTPVPGLFFSWQILSESLMKAVEDVRICGSGTQMVRQTWKIEEGLWVSLL